MSTATAEKPAKAKAPNDARVQLLNVAEIFLDGGNHRLKELTDKAGAAELAKDIGIHGLINPITVRHNADGKAAEKYLVIAGERRFAAVKSLSWAKVECIIEDADEGYAAELRAAENIHRQSLNPLEELLAVEKIAEDATEGATGEQLVEFVAGRLSKSKTWVRDRLYLRRLSAKVRAKLMAGEIPLGHARELAKVVDPGMQEQVWKDACGWDDHIVPSIVALRDVVESQMLSLAQVPWDKTATSIDGAKVPACVTCPHNTDVDKQLFEHHAAPKSMDGEWKGNKREKLAGPFCLKASCYQSKADRCKSAVDKASKTAMKRSEKSGEAEGLERVEGVTKTYVEQRLKEGEAETAQKKGAKSTGDKLSQAERDRREKEKNAKRLERQKQEDASHDRMIQTLSRTPGARFYMWLLLESWLVRDEAFGGDRWGEDRKKPLPPAAIKRLEPLLKPTLSIDSLDKLVAGEFNRKKEGFTALDGMNEKFDAGTRQSIRELLDPEYVKPTEKPAAKKSKPSKRSN